MRELAVASSAGLRGRPCACTFATAHVEPRTSTTWPGSGSVGSFLPVGCPSARSSATVAVPIPAHV